MNPMLTVVLFFLTTIRLHASPIEFSEVSLMLKHGIPSSELVADVKARKLVQIPTPEQLTVLKESGATKELLEAVVAPGNVLGVKESESFLKKKSMAVEPHFWVIGEVFTVKEGVMVVLCQDLPQKKQGLVSLTGLAEIRGKLPSMFKPVESAKTWFINCETRRSGIVQLKDNSGGLQNVSQLELVQDFGRPETVTPSR